MTSLCRCDPKDTSRCRCIDSEFRNARCITTTTTRYRSRPEEIDVFYVTAENIRDRSSWPEWARHRKWDPPVGYVILRHDDGRVLPWPPDLLDRHYAPVPFQPKTLSEFLAIQVQREEEKIHQGFRALFGNVRISRWWRFRRRVSDALWRFIRWNVGGERG